MPTCSGKPTSIANTKNNSSDMSTIQAEAITALNDARMRAAKQGFMTDEEIECAITEAKKYTYEQP